MVRVKHLVLGRGFYGLAVAKALEAEGALMVYADLNTAASKSATGIINPDWFKSGTITKHYKAQFTNEMVDSSISFLNRSGAELELTEEVYYTSKDGEPKTRNVYLAKNLESYLDSYKNKRREKVLTIDTATNTVTTDESVYEAEKLYICLGVNILEFIPDIKIKPLLGEAVFITDRDTRPLVTHYIRPYKHITERHWGKNLARVGDTTQSGDMQMILDKYLDRGLVGVTSGLRPYPTEPIYMHSIHGKAHIFTGGGRVGFCLSGMIGSNLKDILSGKIEL